MAADGNAEPGLGPSPDRVYYRAAVLLLCVGLLMRAYHYFSNPSIWFDEAWLLSNLLEKNYRDLLGPLTSAQVGPPLYLWLEKTAFLCLGDNALIWRLPAFVASLIGLVLFFYVARRILPLVGLPWAVGLFALSDRLLWHTVEVRPYTIDVCVAVAVLAAWLRTETWRLEGRLVLFALAGPLLLLISFPAIFVCAGLCLALLWETWRTGRLVAWILLAFSALELAVTARLLDSGPDPKPTCGSGRSGVHLDGADAECRQPADELALAPDRHIRGDALLPAADRWIAERAGRPGGLPIGVVRAEKAAGPAAGAVGRCDGGCLPEPLPVRRGPANAFHAARGGPPDWGCGRPPASLGTGRRHPPRRRRVGSGIPPWWCPWCSPSLQWPIASSGSWPPGRAPTPARPPPLSAHTGAPMISSSPRPGNASTTTGEWRFGVGSCPHRQSARPGLASG